MANDDVTLTREEAAFTAETLKQVRNTILKTNPSLAKKVNQSLKSHQTALLKLSTEETDDPSPQTGEPKDQEPKPTAIQDS